MQRLLFLRETGHDVADTEGNQARNHLREETARSAAEGNSIPVDVSDAQVQDLLARRRLPLGTFAISVVQPSTNNSDQNENPDGRDERKNDCRVRLLPRVQSAQSS